MVGKVNTYIPKSEPFVYAKDTPIVLKYTPREVRLVVVENIPLMKDIDYTVNGKEIVLDYDVLEGNNIIISYDY